MRRTRKEYVMAAAARDLARPNVAEIARTAGYSERIIYRALNGDPSISSRAYDALDRVLGLAPVDAHAAE